jgi:hypothetical protein
MRIPGKDGKMYTRDHPHEIVSPYVMTFETIRFWMRELYTNPEYGWAPGGRAGLERALGMGAATMKDKLRWSWIWPKEQVRLTARINDILEGRIVPTKFKGGKTEGVWTDPPTPPIVKSVPRKPLVLRAVLGQSILSAPPAPVYRSQQMPQFSEAFKNVQFWNAK